MFNVYSGVHIKILEYFLDPSKYIKVHIMKNTPLTQMLDTLSTKDDREIYQNACEELCKDGLLDNVLKTSMTSEGVLVPRITEKGRENFKRI